MTQNSNCKPQKKQVLRINFRSSRPEVFYKKGVLKIVRPKKIVGNLSDPKEQRKFCEIQEKQLQNLPAQKKRIWPNFKPQKQNEHPCLNFHMSPPFSETMLLIYLLCFLFSFHVTLECLRIMFYIRTLLVALVIIFCNFSKFFKFFNFVKLNLISQDIKQNLS